MCHARPREKRWLHFMLQRRGAGQATHQARASNDESNASVFVGTMTTPTTDTVPTQRRKQRSTATGATRGKEESRLIAGGIGEGIDVCVPHEDPRLAHLICPPHCANTSSTCPRWNPRNVSGWVGSTLALIHQLPSESPRAPATPASLAWQMRLILVTITFAHDLQMLKLKHCARVLEDVRCRTGTHTHSAPP